MRVVISVSAYVAWVPVPKDVEVTQKDISSGRVKPNRTGDGWDMRISRKEPSHTTVGIAESTIIGRIIHEAMPQQGSRLITRKQAVANLLTFNVMPKHAHPKSFTAIKVDSDNGPVEAEFREALKTYVGVPHDQTGEPLIDESVVEDMVKKYMESASASDHEDHLHTHFNVKKSTTPAEVQS